MKEITMEQAKEIAMTAVGNNAWDSMPPLMQTQTMMGAMAMFQAMVVLGYKINSPLKAV